MDDVKEIYETWLHHPEKRTEEVWLAQMRLHYMKGEVDFQLKDRVRIHGYDPRIIMVVEDRLADYMQAVPQSLYGSAQAMAQAGATMFATIAAIPSNTTAQAAAAMSMASEFSNVLCLLGNVVNTQQTYPDYTPLYGASNCSSTNDGSPVSEYADTNPFYAVAGSPQNAPASLASAAPAYFVPVVPVPTVAITPAAQQSLALINHSDPVLAPMPIPPMGVAAATIAAGVRLQ